jgi:hypothetical protein
VLLGFFVVVFCIQCRLILVWFGLVYDVLRHFKKYFSHIVEVRFIGGGNRRVPGENHRPAASYWQTTSIFEYSFCNFFFYYFSKVYQYNVFKDSATNTDISVNPMFFYGMSYIIQLVEWRVRKRHTLSFRRLVYHLTF